MPNAASESRKIAKTIGFNVDSIADNGIYAYLNGKTDHDGHSCFWVRKDDKVRVIELMLLLRSQQRELCKGEIELPVPKVKDPDFGIFDHNDSMKLFECKYPNSKIQHVAGKGNLFKLNLDEVTLNTYIKHENEKIRSSELNYKQYTCNTYVRNILSGLQKELCHDNASDNASDNRKFLQGLCQKASTKVHGRWFLNIAGKEVDTGIGKYVVPDNIAKAIEANKKNIYLKPDEYQEKLISSIAQMTNDIKPSLNRDKWTENLYKQAKAEKKSVPVSIFFEQIISETHQSNETNHAQKL
ncbi:MULTISPECIES: hypothetical protein [Cysteiniphilum]|uniref:Uncharacterized protein n=1 Tax=Cysteiniphilum litorale TaxID=2056700 RepID=A0A8J3EA99_9GAMM|nr:MULTISPECIES: hypothetical protein [Cysteiniphilum]GGG04909.1 hypothetical protein GCM10010995_22910 [Cysteiniphilum litorale]